MTDTANKQEEFALQAIFSRAIPPVVDENFSSDVLRHIRRNIWRRRLVLLFAITVGLVIGLPAIAQFLLSFGDALTEFATNAQDAEAFGQIGILLSMLPLREGAQAMSQEIAGFSAQIGTLSWYLQNKAYLLAGLMTGLSLVATRVLVR